MNITVKPVENSAFIPSRMEALYLDAFPPEERRPWEMISDLADNDPRFTFNIVERDGIPAGFITLWNLGEAFYCEHFAMHPSMRGGGAGGEVVRTLCNTLPMPLVLEVEPEDSNPMASRRIGFYSRNGMTFHGGYTYIQPPYAPGLPSIELKLMTSVPDVDLDLLTHRIHSIVYGVENA